MRTERRDPEVILDVVFDRGLLFLVVAILGGRPAHRVKFAERFSGSREAGPLNAQANEVAIETLELAHEGFELE